MTQGPAWFDQIEDQRGMQLISATPYRNGVVGLHYKPTTPPLPPPPNPVDRSELP